MHGSSVLGDDWRQTFFEFRINPDNFFGKRKLTREAFCLDILRDINLDHVDIHCKIHTLLVLQEQSPVLIKDANLLEQICGSLKNLFNVLKSSCENRPIRSQILLCITTILLSSDLEDGLEELFSGVKRLLLDVIHNQLEDFVVISAACKCLEEFEVSFPGILENELRNIFSSCENNLSPTFENYATLISLCIKNKSYLGTQGKTLENGTIKSDLDKDGVQLPAVISHLMELIPLMSPLSVYRVLKDLILVVQQSHEISPVVFKFFLPKLIFSSEVLYFNLAFDLLEAFHSELFSPQEEKCLFRQLLLLSSHPCLSSSHRMLFLDWLKICILKKDLFSGPLSLLKSVLPSPFDGPVTQEKKCSVLAAYVPKTVDENLGLDFLDESLCGLKKCALLPQRTKAAPSFFRTLFVYFSHHKPEMLHDYIYKLLLNIMKTSPHLLQYTLNFLDAVKVKFPDSSFPKEVLSHMVEHILSLRMKQFTGNLECYLAILEQASEVCGYECKPRSILRLLQGLLSESAVHEINVWEFGNNILSVCRSILLFHNVQLCYYDLAEILCLISQSVDDAEVEYRATIYYNELITLSKLKMQSIFKMKKPEKDQCYLASFGPGVTSNLQFAPRVQLLAKPVVELVRIKKNWNLPDTDTSNTNSLSADNIFEIYKAHTDANDSVVSLPFLLKHVSDSEKIFNKLYGIVISTRSSPPCKKISVIEIPVYKKSDTAIGDNVFHIDIVPCASHPMELNFKVEFTCENGQSYICHPDPVFLNFKDLYLPLPIPRGLKDYSSSWKSILFEYLWTRFEKETELCSDRRCCKSAICLKMNKEELSFLIEEHWKQFTVAKWDEFKLWVAVFLPPKNHLMMKIDLVNEKPFIRFVVDDTSILPWIALYLQKITKN